MMERALNILIIFLAVIISIEVPVYIMEKREEDVFVLVACTTMLVIAVIGKITL